MLTSNPSACTVHSTFNLYLNSVYSSPSLLQSPSSLTWSTAVAMVTGFSVFKSHLALKVPQDHPRLGDLLGGLTRLSVVVPMLCFITARSHLLPAQPLTGDSGHAPALPLPSSCHLHPHEPLLPLHRLCFLLLFPHVTNYASLSGSTVSTFLPPSALYKNQWCLILLWSYSLQ